MAVLAKSSSDQQVFTLWVNSIEDTVNVDQLKPTFTDADEPDVPSRPPDRKEISPIADPNPTLECTRPPSPSSSRADPPPE